MEVVDLERLKKELEMYVSLIVIENAQVIPANVQEKLSGDLSEVLKVKDTGTISLLCNFNDFKIYLPYSAITALEELKSHPLFKSVPGHVVTAQEQLVKNENTFTDYINHVILAGLTPTEFYEETLLHETMHLCGSGGADALSEGMTELKTRELAQKYDLLTSGCGYPKEVKIVLQLKELFGGEVIDKLTFTPSTEEKLTYLNEKLGEEAANFYYQLHNATNESFQEYIKTRFKGPNAAYDKAATYQKIDYTRAYNLIEKYQESKKKK